ncbi:MAG: ABC transporter permease [Pseudomonadota bacterium]
MSAVVALLRRQPMLVMLGALVLVCAASVEGFLTLQNLASILRQSTVLGCLALGQTFVIAAGMLDLSVGSLVSLVVVLCAHLMDGHSGWALPGALAALALGATVGALTGLLNRLLAIHPLILTLGMMTVLNGAVFVYTDQSAGAPSPAVTALVESTVAGMPVAFLLVLATTLLCDAGLRRTRFGLHLLASGGEYDSARHAGIAVERMQFVAFALSGLFAGMAGLLLLGRLGTGYPNAGTGLELDAIVAVVLGGASLAGGRAGMVASLCGAVLLGVVNNMLNLLDISSFVQMTAKGLIVLAVVIANQPPKRVYA